jgi:ribonucleotide reductase alpha subunit
VYINPLHWDKKNQKIRNVIEIENRDEINSKLAKLKIHIIDEHNIAFMDGKIIDKQWIDNSISKFLLRPKTKLKVNLSHNIYLTDFMTWWLDNKASEWKIGI